MRVVTHSTIYLDLELEDISHVYSGLAGMCMCGCSGKYYYAEKHRRFASDERGYKVQDSEINDKMVKRVYNMFVSLKYKIENLDNDIFTIHKGKRKYVIYLSKKAKEVY